MEEQPWEDSGRKHAADILSICTGTRASATSSHSGLCPLPHSHGAPKAPAAPRSLLPPCSPFHICS